MFFDTTEEAALSILNILEDEANRFGIQPIIERRETKGLTTQMMLSLKKNGEVFRITFNWVRGQRALQGLLFGNAYIERNWDLALVPENKTATIPGPPFVWELRSRDKSVPPSSYPAVMTAPWLRTLIRGKLARLAASKGQ